jgi:hypothetical protein
VADDCLGGKVSCQFCKVRLEFERLRDCLDDLSKALEKAEVDPDMSGVTSLIASGQLEELVPAFGTPHHGPSSNFLSKLRRDVEVHLDALNQVYDNGVRRWKLDEAIDEANRLIFEPYHTLERVRQAWIDGELSSPVSDEDQLAEWISDFHSDPPFVWVESLGCYCSINS